MLIVVFQFLVSSLPSHIAFEVSIERLTYFDSVDDLATVIYRFLYHVTMDLAIVK